MSHAENHVIYYQKEKCCLLLPPVCFLNCLLVPPSSCLLPLAAFSPFVLPSPPALSSSHLPSLAGGPAVDGLGWRNKNKIK